MDRWNIVKRNGSSRNRFPCCTRFNFRTAAHKKPHSIGTETFPDVCRRARIIESVFLHIPPSILLNSTNFFHLKLRIDQLVTVNRGTSCSVFFVFWNVQLSKYWTNRFRTIIITHRHFFFPVRHYKLSFIQQIFTLSCICYSVWYRLWRSLKSRDRRLDCGWWPFWQSQRRR